MSSGKVEEIRTETHAHGGVAKAIEVDVVDGRCLAQ